jgi:hypothetical protein
MLTGRAAIIRRARSAVAGLRHLLACTSGVGMIEMAAVAPLILVTGLGGLEVATLATAKMKIGQVALSVSDNVARLGQTDNSGVTPTVTEASVDAILKAAVDEGGIVNLQQNGRVIVSSLEWDEDSDKPYIHWQRCKGGYQHASAYGDDGMNNGLGSDPLPPIGRGTIKFMPKAGQAVILVEVYYQHEGLLNNVLPANDMLLVEEGGLEVRDDRNLTPGLTGGPTESPCT